MELYNSLYTVLMKSCETVIYIPRGVHVARQSKINGGVQLWTQDTSSSVSVNAIRISVWVQMKYEKREKN